MENNENVTLNTILNVMNSKFDQIDKRFDGIDNRLDIVDARLDGIDDRLDGIDDRLDGIDNRLDIVDERLDGIDNRLDGIDDRLDSMDTRLDNIDIRIARVDGENKEAHEKILEELHRQGNIVTKIETEYNDKISILFDANEYARNRMHLFGSQQLRFSQQLEDFSYRLLNLEKAMLANN